MIADHHGPNPTAARAAVRGCAAPPPRAVRRARDAPAPAGRGIRARRDRACPPRPQDREGPRRPAGARCARGPRPGSRPGRAPPAARPRAQRHRHRAPHQSRALAVLGGRARGDRGGGARLLEPGVRPGIRRPRAAWDRRRALAHPAHGRGGGARRQQRRGRDLARAVGAHDGEAGRRVARRAGRDRRLVPGAGRDAEERGGAARGGHHEPHASPGLRPGARAPYGSRGDPARPSQQLPDLRLHDPPGAAGARGPGAPPQGAADRGSGQRGPGRPLGAGPGARAHGKRKFDRGM